VARHHSKVMAKNGKWRVPESDPRLREILQVVTQSEDQPVTGIHAQRGSFAAIAVGIAVTDFAMIKEVAVSNGHFKLAVLTA